MAPSNSELVMRNCIKFESGSQVYENVTNELGDLLTNDLKKQLPQVVVVGLQSAGKSSLLKLLTDLPLPTGVNTTTRAPLVISMRPAMPEAAAAARLSWYAGGKLYEKALNLAALEGELSNGLNEAQIQVQSCGGECLSLGTDKKNKDIKLLYEKLRLESSSQAHKSPVTLVDLPGMVENTTDGAKDLRPLMNKYIKHYICADEVLILAVNKASLNPLQINAALPMAREVDPSGSRTLMIYTNVDRLSNEERKEMLSVLQHERTVQDYVVVCGLSEDSAREKAMKDAEDAGFSKAQLGMDALWSKLAIKYEQMVDNALPSLRNKFEDAIAQLKKQEGELNCDVLESEEAARKKVAEQIRTLDHLFSKACNGTISPADFNPKTISVMKKCQALKENIMKKCEQYALCQDSFIPAMLGRHSVYTSLVTKANTDGANSYADELGKTISEVLFSEYHQHVAKSAKEFVQGVKTCVRELLLALVENFFASYPKLMEKANAAVKHVVELAAEDTSKLVLEIVQAHHSMVETMHTNVVYMTYVNQLRMAATILEVNSPFKLPDLPDELGVEYCNDDDQPQGEDPPNPVGPGSPTGVQDSGTTNDPDLSRLGGSDTRIDNTKTKISFGELKRLKEGVAAASAGRPAGDVAKKPDTTVQTADLIRGQGSKASQAKRQMQQATINQVAASLAAISLQFTPLGALQLAQPVGQLVGTAVGQLYLLMRKAMDMYKLRYDKDTAGALPPRLPEEYHLRVQLWDPKQEPLTSFEMMCKLMNCAPGYVVAALLWYKEKLEQHVKGLQVPKYEAKELLMRLIHTMARMLYSHYSMTESVNKITRSRLASFSYEGLGHKVHSALQDMVKLPTGQHTQEPFLALMHTDNQKVLGRIKNGLKELEDGLATLQA